MGESVRLVRYNFNPVVPVFLLPLFVLSYALRKEIWKDVY
jgi:cytochrome c1